MVAVDSLDGGVPALSSFCDCIEFDELPASVTGDNMMEFVPLT